MADSRLRAALPWLGALACWGLAAALRLRHLDLAVPDEDAVAPFAAAWTLLDGRLPAPHHPHFGDGLWGTALPLVLAAHSLTSLFALRFALGGAVAALGFATAWLLTPRSGWRRGCAALGAGLLVAADAGLTDSLISGARGYGAPEFVGLAFLGAAGAARGRGWGLPLLVGGTLAAVHHHPLTLGLLPGLALFAVPAWRAAGGWGRGMALTLALVGAGLPIARLATGHLDPAAVALGSSSASPLGGLPLLGATLRAWAALDHRWTWALLPLGLALGLPSRAAWAALAGGAGIAVLGLSVAHLEVYHLRVAAVPIAVAAALGWARLGPAPLLAAGLALGTWRLPERPRPDLGSLAEVDVIARAVAAEPGPVWLDRASLGPGGCLPFPSVVLSMELQGLSTDGLVLDPGASLLLITCGAGAIPGAAERWRHGDHALQRMPGLTAGHAWARSLPPGRLDAGDATTWAALLGRPALGLEVTRWWEAGWPESWSTTRESLRDTRGLRE